MWALVASFELENLYIVGMHFTEHAKKRMAERRISELSLFDLFADSKLVITVSKKDNSLLVATGKAGERMLTAVFDPITESVVTTRVASKKERRAYAEHPKN